MGGHSSANPVNDILNDTPSSRLLLYQSGLWKYPDQSYPKFLEHHNGDTNINRDNLPHIKFDTQLFDPCYNLQLKEYQCVSSSTTEEESATKCVKWYNEWIQCKWDHEKMTRGYNYIEPRPERKHKSYIAAPNYQYS